MANEDEHTDFSSLAKLRWNGANLLFLAGALGSLFYILLAPADVDRVGGGLSCVLLFSLGFTGRCTNFLAERVDRLEQGITETQESAEV